MKNNKSITSSIGKAYDLVIADLFTRLKKIKDGDRIKLGNLGTFHKRERTITSSLTKTYGESYAYYQVTFKASKELKKELDK